VSALKTALILASGAMTGAYQCGVLKAFKEAKMAFDVVIGSSVGAYNGARYLADQMDICEKIYLDDLTGDKFIKFSNIFKVGRHVMDLDYVVYGIDKNKALNVEKIIRAKSDFYITALEATTMETRFFDAKHNDIFLLLKATAAIPYVYSGKVFINGKRYFDGGLFEPIPAKKAIELGCKRLYIILNRAQKDKRPLPVPKQGIQIFGSIPRLFIEHYRLKNEAEQFLYQQHRDITIHVIRPSLPLPCGRFTREREKLQFCIDAGYRQGLDFIQMM